MDRSVFCHLGDEYLFAEAVQVYAVDKRVDNIYCI